MSKIELKPCPFCGKQVLIAKDNHNKFLIECENCKLFFGIEVENGTEIFEWWKATLSSVEEAVRSWNRRANEMKNAMAERYISIGEIEKAYSEILNEECEIDDDFKAGYQAGILAAMAVPAADVAPVVHGHWIEKIIPGEVPDYGCVCSICEGDGLPSYEYCPNCGAKMDEGEGGSIE